MLKLTKTGIGLLTRQYRAVLRKCFLINIGVWAMGTAAVGINIASTTLACAADATSRLVVNSGQTVTTSDNYKNFSATDVNGGAIQNQGTLTITGGTFEDNTALNGGAIVNEGTLIITGGTFEGNSARGGGAIEIRQGNGSATISGAIFKNNVGANGGALEIAPGATQLVKVSNSSFTGNNTNYSGSSTYYQGGAILVGRGGNLEVYNSTFTGNSDKNVSGGVYTWAGTILLEDSSFYDNTTTSNNNAGAVVIQGTEGGYSASGTIRAKTKDVTFSGNKGGSTAIDVKNQTSLTLDTASGKSITFGGQVIGTGATTKTGAGTVNFNDKLTQNSFTINAGTVNINVENLLASTITNAGTLNTTTYSSSSQTKRTITNTGTIKVVNTSSHDWYFPHNITNTGGTVIFDNQATNNYWLKTQGNITGGTVEINPTRGTSNTNNRVEIVGSNTWNIDNLKIDGASLYYYSGSPVVTTKAITNNGYVYNTNSFTLAGTGNNSLGKFTGGGTLNITNTGTTTANSSIENAINISSGATVNGNFSNFGGTITNNGTLGTYGTIGKTVSGSGTVKLTGATTLSGNYLSGQTLNMNGQTLTMNSTGSRSVSKLTGGGNLSLYLSGSSASTIAASSSGSSGTYTITGISGSKPTSTTTYDILTGVNSSTYLASDLSTYTTSTSSYTYDTIKAATAWTDTYYVHTTTQPLKGTYSVDNSTPATKKLKITVTNNGSATTSSSKWDDTLYLVNTATNNSSRTFNAASAGSTHDATTSPGTTYGTLKVDGNPSSSGTGAHSTLNLGSNSGFTVPSSRTLTLEDLTLSGTGSYYVSNTGGTVNLNGVTTNGAKLTGSSGTLNLSGTNSISGNLAYTGTKNVTGGETSFGGTVGALNITGSSAKVNIDPDNLTGTVANSGTLNLNADGTLSQTVSGSGDLVIGGMVTMSSATTGGKLIFSNDSSDYVNGIAATKAEIDSGDKYDIVTAAAVRDYISEYGGGSSIDVDTTFDKTSTNPATSAAIANFLDTNYSRKLTKASCFCDGLDGKIEPDLEDKITPDFEGKINESPLDLAQIVKGSTASKASAQSASIVGVRIGGTPDGLYDNLIKKAEDPLTHSPFGSARDDNITFAAANDNHSAINITITRAA